DHGRGLEYQHHQGGIPPAPSCILAYTLLWLPPILYGGCQDSISGYSKAQRGLSVLSRVTCIFTGNMISQSLSFRQCPNRCSLCPAHYVPHKEFRDLRTVIVTAADDWGFNLHLRSEELSARLNLTAPGIRQTLYVTFRFGSELCFR